MAVEVVIKVGVQILFWVHGGWLNKTKLIQISTQLEVLFEDVKEKVLKINFHRWVGGDGWLAGSSGTKTISSFNSVKVEVEARS